MSRPPSLDSWRDMGSLANENSREAPSHRECHYNIPGSAQTYTLWAWKHTRTHTCTCTQLCRALHVGMFTLSQCSTCIFKLICQTHESVHADTFTYELGCRGQGRDSAWQVLCRFPRVATGAESQRDRGEGGGMPLVQPSVSNDTMCLWVQTFCQGFFCWLCSYLFRLYLCFVSRCHGQTQLPVSVRIQLLMDIIKFTHHISHNR